MQSVEAEGSTIDEAIEKALESLQIERERVEIEILSDSARGLFGLRGKKARVRATIRQPLWSAQGGAGGDSAPDAPPRGRRTTGRSGRRSASGQAASPSAGEAQTPVRQPREKVARPDAEATEEQREGEAREPAPVSREVAERGAEFLRETLELMKIEATVDVELDPESEDAIIQVDGDSSGVIIGRHGQTLDAIEYIVNRLVAREQPGTSHIVVDAAGYRARRRQSLTEMARRLAEKAKRERRTVTVNPLSPRDRRIIHIALRNDKGVTTRSHGTGLERKLLIVPWRHGQGEEHRRA
jgi:spoIIIJ-associated protein